MNRHARWIIPLALLVGAWTFLRMRQEQDAPKQAAVAEAALPSGDGPTGAAPMRPVLPALRGVLRDTEGNPVAGASLFLAVGALPPSGQDVREAPLDAVLAALHGGGAFSQAEDGARTAVDGRFQLQPRSGLPWIIWADDGERGAVVERLEDAPDGLELTRLPLQVVAGVVRDEEERPVRGAHVHLLGEWLHLDVRAVTGEDGRYSLSLPAGSFTVVADAAGYAPQRQGPAPGSDSLDFTLERLHRCRVRVTRAGRSVAARVHVQDLDAPQKVLEAPGGELELETTRGAGLKLYAEDDSGVSRGKELRPENDGTCELALPLEAGLRLQVKVEDVGGEPVADADVTAEGHEMELKARTDTAGLATLPPMPAGDWVVDAATEDGKARVEDVRLERDGQRVTLVLEPSDTACTVSGTIVSPRVTVETALLYQCGTYQAGKALHPDGRFSVSVLCGEVEVSLVVPNVGRGSWKGTAPASGVEVTLDAGSGLDVRVTSDRGAVRGADVSLEPSERHAMALAPRLLEVGGNAETDARGRAGLRGIPPGAYLLRVEAARFAPSSPLPVRVEAGRVGALEVRLDSGVPLRGRVVDDTGHPLRGAEVSAAPVEKGALQPEATESLRDGTFEFPALQRGARYRLIASSPDDSREDSAPVEATTGDAPVVLTLRRPQEVTGRVLGENGSPLQRFSVDGEEKEDAQGRFSVRVQPANPGDLVPRAFALSSAGYQPKRVTVPPGSGALGDIQLERGTLYQGTVVDEAGRAVRGARVCSGEAEEETLTDGEGRYAVVSVTGQLRAEKDDLRGSVERAADAPTIVLHGLARVSGQAWSSPRRPAHELKVSCFPFPGPEGVQPADDQGRFAVELPPGRCSATADGVGEVSFNVQGAPLSVVVGPAPGTHELAVSSPRRIVSVRAMPEVPTPERLSWSTRPGTESGVLRGLPAGTFELRWATSPAIQQQYRLKLKVQVPAPAAVSLPER